jgi:hypothetical protein
MIRSIKINLVEPEEKITLSEMFEFIEWRDKNRWQLEYREQRDFSNDELWNEFKNWKQLKNQSK